MGLDTYHKRLLLEVVGRPMAVYFEHHNNKSLENYHFNSPTLELGL